jgi:hypothetical protein
MKKLVIVTFTLVAAIGVLVWVGVQAASIPVVRVGELKGGAHWEEEVRIDDGKVVAITGYSPLSFSVASEKDPANVLLVTSERSVPENFKVGSNVGLRGIYRRDRNVFDAYQVSTQCPSKYEASKDAEKEAAGGIPSASSLSPPDPRGPFLSPGPGPVKVAN